MITRLVKTSFKIVQDIQLRPGNNKALWDAVKIAKDQNIEDIPDQMHLNGIPIPNEDLAEAFVNMFENKLKENFQTRHNLYL